MDSLVAQKLKLQPAPIVAAEINTSASDVADRVWTSLAPAELDHRRARRGRIVTAARIDIAHVGFDVLRTKILRSLRQNKWTSIAVTSPTPGCGKSVVALNLAFSLANLSDCRTVLLDVDFRRPRISSLLGPDMARPTAGFLGGKRTLEESFVRYGKNLAVSASGSELSLSAELLQSPSAREAMTELKNRLNPDVILLDLPPALGSDDVLAILPNVDCALIVVGAGSTSPAQVDLCERELAKETKLLGIVLNKCRHPQHGIGYY